MPRRVFITVGEVSGDHHAAELTRALRQLDPSIQVEGHGGTAMRDAGAAIHHETVGRAAMLLQSLARSAEVWRLLRWTRDYYRRSPPDLRSFGSAEDGDEGASPSAIRHPPSSPAPVVGLMPGSRRSEVRANGPHMLAVADRVAAAFPGTRFEVPTTPPTDAVVRRMMA